MERTASWRAALHKFAPSSRTLHYSDCREVDYHFVSSIVLPATHYISLNSCKCLKSNVAHHISREYACVRVHMRPLMLVNNKKILQITNTSSIKQAP